MKLKKTLIYILIFLMLALTVMVSKNVSAIDKSTQISNHNNSVLDKVKTLQELADAYKAENASVTDTTIQLCLQYIRNGRYSGGSWDIFAGKINSGFITYLGSKENVPTFNNDTLLDPTTGKEIDFVHMIAALNAYLKNGDAVYNMVSTDYAGWAGDLITLLEEVTTYRVNEGITSTEIIQEYTNSLLGTNNPSTCSSSDMLSDLDSLALYKDSNSDVANDLYSALKKYYITNDSTYNSNNRLASAQTILGGTKATVKAKATTLLTNTDIMGMNIKQTLFSDSSMVANVTTEDINAVAESFTKYIFGEPYLKLNKNSAETIIGAKDLNIKIIESNANLSNNNIQIVDESITEAIIDGEYLVIKPKKGGVTQITVKSVDAVDTFDLTVNDIAPSITKNINEIYELALGEQAHILIEAEGTNNTYTWYIGDSADGAFDKIAGATNNSYTLVPTLEMNNKYIKCVIKNYGNEEVESNVANIKVYSATEDETTDDTKDEITNTIPDGPHDTTPDKDVDINEDINTNMPSNTTSDATQKPSTDEQQKPAMLPQTGNGITILIAILVLIVVIVFAYIQIRRYKEI